MSFLPRRPTGAEPVRGASPPVRWLVSLLMGASGLLASLEARPSHPYLAVATPMPLRFAPPAPDAALAEQPAAEIVSSADPSPPANEPTRVEVIAPAPTEPTVEAPPAPMEPAEAPVSGPPPVSILPDDLSPRSSAEDFLPYFVPPQLPSTPASRATYRRQ